MGRWSILVVALALGGVTSVARADGKRTPKAPPAPPPAPEAPKPWAEGVSQDNQDKALALYKDGNALLEQSNYKGALDKFVAALAFWDHPAIHYNAGVCLINLDRPVEASEHIQASLKFGDAPLGNELYVKGQTYQEMLARQIGEIDIVAQDTGVVLRLDGEPVVATLGTVKKRVRIGDHQIVATKPSGYLPETQTVHVGSGEDKQITIVLKPIPKSERYARRFSESLPVKVMIGGGVVAALALPSFLVMRSDYGDYRHEVLQLCSHGCYQGAVPAAADDKRKAGDRFQTLGWATLGVGTVAIAGGFVLLAINQPRLVSPVTPVVGADRVGLAISGSW